MTIPKTDQTCRPGDIYDHWPDGPPVLDVDPPNEIAMCCAQLRERHPGSHVAISARTLLRNQRGRILELEQQIEELRHPSSPVPGR